jgi:hypothetical protein
MDYTNEKVKVYLKNGQTAEGIIALWDDTQMILAGEDTDNALVIFLPQENIIMMKILLAEQNAVIEKPLAQYEYDRKMKQIQTLEYGPRQKKLLELKQQEAHGTNYDSPNFTK